jgi:hypothetical protein
MDEWDALKNGPYKMNQDALPIPFVTFHYRVYRAAAYNVPRTYRVKRGDGRALHTMPTNG